MYQYFLTYFDLPILHAINGFCGQSWLLDRLISHVALDFKWAIPLCIFWVLWFKAGEEHAEYFQARASLPCPGLASLPARGC